jgi:hypothetical protein
MWPPEGKRFMLCKLAAIFFKAAATVAVSVGAWMAAVLAQPAWAAERFAQKVPLDKGLVAVVAEGEFEARSTGSYTVRAYFDAEAGPGNETTFYAAGLVRPRDGTVRSAAPLARPGQARPLLMVVVQSAGSGGYLSADAFAVEPRAVRLLASVSDLAPGEDPAAHLMRRLGSPAGAALQFLRAYQPLASAGVPKPAQLEALGRHLHPDLRRSLETVSTQQAASRCEGPPALQGDLITSLFEGPNEFQVMNCRIRTLGATCPVRFTYRGTPEGVRWTDEIELRLHADRWVVQDVVQGAPWSGKSRLSSRLAEASRVLSTCR